MTASEPFEGEPYSGVYKSFDSPLMRQVRLKAYGKDIGQHSWTSADEIEHYLPRLGLSRGSRFLDLGCGPCGPLAFIVSSTECQGWGADLSAAAIAAGRNRIASLGVEHLVSLQQFDFNKPLPFRGQFFDSVISLDVILHLHDRASVFQEIARILSPGGRFLFTDPAVVTGPISNEAIQLRCLHGYTQFVPPRFNDEKLNKAGFSLVECTDRTESLLKNASGRLAAREAYREQLQALEGNEDFERQQRYLAIVTSLAETGALSRISYLAVREP